jgi:hypothetical protein
MLLAWGLDRYKSSTWSETHSLHILVNAPGQAEVFAVEWLKRRGFNEIRNNDDKPQFGKCMVDGVRADRCFTQKYENLSGPVNVSLFVNESTPHSRLGAPPTRASVVANVTIGYRDVWPWERISYQDACQQLWTDFQSWFSTELPQQLEATAKEGSQGV